MATVDVLEPGTEVQAVAPANSPANDAERMTDRTEELRETIARVLAPKDQTLPGRTMFEQMAAPAINGVTYPGTDLPIADTPMGRIMKAILDIIDHPNSITVADLGEQRHVEALMGQLNPNVHSAIIERARHWLNTIRSAPRMP